MKTLLAAASAVALAVVMNFSPASAAQYSTATVGTPHYEWQYHYVGHHPHYQGYWALVK